jgi:hypothetical protein
LELNEIEDKPNCNFIIEDYKKGNLICLIDINKYKDKSLLTFKTSEFNFENHVIYASKLNEIYLINNIKDNISEDDDNNKGDNKKAIIIGCCIGGVFFIGGCIALIIYLLKRRKKQIYFDPTKNDKKILYSNINNNNNNKINIMENDCKSNEPVFK